MKFFKLFIRHKHNRKHLLLALLILFSGFLLSAVLAIFIKNEIEANEKREFDLVCSEITTKISTRLHSHAQLLRGGAAFIMSSNKVSRAEWRQFIDHLEIERNLPGIQGVGYAIIINPANLSQHEMEIRKEGFPEYSVRPSGKREIYTSIIYLEPFSGRNLRAFGYDMFPEPVRRKAMELSRDNNAASLSGRIRLVQETDTDVQAGTIMYVPVYNKALPIASVEERRKAILGWVYIPYRMNDLMSGILGGYATLQNNAVSLRIYDEAGYNKSSLLYNSAGNETDQINDNSLFTLNDKVVFNGHAWHLQYSRTNSLTVLTGYSRIMFTLFGGFFMSILLFIIYFLLIRTNTKAKELAEELTRELSDSESKYKTIFNNAIYAICIFDIETLRFLDVNDAYCRTYGYSRDELISGMTIHDITSEHGPSDQAVNRAVKEETTFIPLRYHKKKEGTSFPVEIVGGPYTWRGRKVMFALAHDISDRIKAEEKITCLLKEKELLLRETHHRIKNNMTMVASMLLLQESELQADSREGKTLLEAAGRVRSMMLLYDQLYRSDNFVEIEAGVYLTELINKIMENLPDTNSVTIEKDICDVLINAKKIQPLGIIVNELLTNAVKYAFTGMKAGHITIQLSAMDNKLTFTMTDNGRGLPENINFENSPGFGLMMIRLMTQQLNGRLAIDRSNGTRITLEFLN